MAKNSNFPLLLIAVVAIFYFSRLGVAATNLKVNLRNISIKKSGGLNLPRILLDFTIQNVTNQPIFFRSLVGDIFINGSYFANISNFNQIQITPRSAVNYPVEVQINFLDFIPLFKQLAFPVGKRKLIVKGKLTLNANNLIIPVEINQTIL